MKTYLRPHFLVGLLLLGASCLPAAEPAPQPLKLRAARASSVYGDFTADKAIDGIISDTSRWTSASSKAPAWLELDLGATHTLAGLHLYTGLGTGSALRDFKVQFWSAGQWIDIPSATVAGNKSTALSLAFDDTVTVKTDRLRLWIIATPDGYARIKEVLIWPASGRTLPPLAVPTAAHGAPVAPTESLPLIYLNQSGFNLGRSKRFTAPTLPDGTPFEVRPASGGAAVLSAKIAGHIGDFSAFDPANDHHFGWELHTLVPQWLSNPAAYTRMPRQISYEPPTDPKLWGALTPYRADIPDLVKLIHWGADIIVTQRLGHEHLKAQLAYFLYAWPWLRDYLPAQNYTVVRDYAFATWTTPTADHVYPYEESPEHDLLALKTKVGSTKGALPPGFSIEPNLLLYEVARRARR